jgi:hypothetical protein
MCTLFAGVVHADFDLVGRIPAPLSICGTPRYVMGLASDGSDLFVATDCMGGSYVYLISPQTGAISAGAEFHDGLPGCPNDHPHLRSAAYDYDNRYYWVGNKPRDLIALRWVDTDSIEIIDSFGAGEIQMPNGLTYGGSQVLYVIDRVDSNLVKVGTDGSILELYALPGIPNPSGLAGYGDNLFVLSGDETNVYEITREAQLVEVHSLGDAYEGCCGGEEPSLQGATFHENLLYVGGNSDSISIFAFSDSGLVIPEGDSVSVGLPGELELTFESVVDSGLLYVDETEEEDPCPAPPGVQLFPEFYEVSATAFFDFVVQVAVLDSVLPEGVPDKRVRVFTRPSGPCGAWRDATIDYVETTETFKILRRARSEDDEFSWFAIADDSRRPADIVYLKFGYLRGHINSGQDSIPPAALADILAALDAAEDAYCKGQPVAAQAFLEDLEAVVRNTAEIPHTFDPDNPGTNLAGRIISRAHTLAFSLTYSDDEALVSTASVDAGVIRIGIPGLPIRAIVEIPEGLDPGFVDPDCVYMEGIAKCLPGSLSVADYDDDGQPEVRAVFRTGDVDNAFQEEGPATVAISCFIDGYEVRATADVEILMPVAAVFVEEILEGGNTYTVSWEGFNCGSLNPYVLSFSMDAGMTWEIVDASIVDRVYGWLVPDVSTSEGLLRVTCYDQYGAVHPIYSDLLVITSTAGVDGIPAHEFRLALSPNPTSGGLNVEFASPRAQHAELNVYSVRGEVVKMLFRGRMDEGVQRVYWRGDNRNGRRVSPGTYFVVFKGETRTLTEKVVIQR